MRPPLRRTIARPAFAVAVVVAGLLAAEGAASLRGGRLLLAPRLRAAFPAASRAPGASADVFAQRPELDTDPTAGSLVDAARDATGPPAAEGVYRVHADPLVGYTLRPNRRQVVAGADVRSDSLGLRVAPGPAPAAGAPRIAVLGDSVAFGYGLRDDETIACNLASLLNASRGPLEPAVTCRTVAMPGWNHANSTHFLLDHLDALAPDIVICVPVGNDLVDTDGMDEHGMRCATPDIAQRDPWLSVYQGASLAWLKPVLQEILGDPAAAAERLGARALEADLSPESSSRYDAQAASIALLSDRLAERGARLVVMPYVGIRASWILAERLATVAPQVPLVPLFTHLPLEFTLGDDPHPNAGSAAVMATWMAAELLQRGWVSRGAGLPLPPVDAARAALRAPPLSAGQPAQICAALQAEARGQLRSALDLRTAEGVAQVYGGLNGDGSAGARLAFVLGRPPGATALDVELAPIAARPDLLPLAIEVQADGVALGTLRLAAGEPTTRTRFTLPAAASAAAPLEVRLVPERWVTAPVRGRETMVSFRPVRVACVGP